MKIAVLGAGVVGVTTAYYLTELGHRVVLVDRATEVASGTSYANGAQLCYSFVDAMASPAFATKLPSIVAGSDKAIRVRPPIDSNLIRWGMSFLTQCTAKKARGNTVALINLANRSARLLQNLVAKTQVDFSFRRAGKLVLLTTKAELDSARKSVALKTAHGSTLSIVDMDAAMEIEPAIERMKGAYIGAIYSPNDEVGDARAFSAGLTRHMVANGSCELMLNTQVRRLAAKANHVYGVLSNHGLLEADAAVVCMGAASHEVLTPLGVDPGIYPVRGYSFTFAKGPATPAVSVTDLNKRFVISTLDRATRLAGFADFVGFNAKSDGYRQTELLQVVKECAPEVADYSAENNAWAGLRPVTASGRPLVGPTSIRNLYLNIGHGSLGWTLACATGHDLGKSIL